MSRFVDVIRASRGLPRDAKQTSVAATPGEVPAGH
jgi:hypothetical protein